MSLPADQATAASATELVENATTIKPPKPDAETKTAVSANSAGR